MKKLSATALAAALVVVSATAVVVPPASAQKKEKAPKAPAVSDEFRTPAVAAQKALDAKDWATAEPQVIAAEAAAKSPYEQSVATGFRLTLEANRQPRNSEALAKVLDALLADPALPVADQARYSYARGTVAFDQQQYAASIPFFERARQLNYNGTALQQQLLRAYLLGDNMAGAKSEMETYYNAQKAAGQKVEDGLLNMLVKKLYDSGDTAGALLWVKREVADYPNAANWRNLIAVFASARRGAAQPLSDAERLDLFRFQRFAKAMSESDVAGYTRMTQAGLPWETVAVIDEASKAGVIKAANKGSFDMIRTQAQAKVASEGPIAPLEKSAAASKDGKFASQTGDAYLASGNYAKAIELYRLALEKGGVNADQVNLHIGVALARSGQAAEAKAAFAQVKTGNLAEIAGLWTLFIDAPPAPATAGTN